MTAACCACYPPGDLEDDGATMKTGSDRYFYGHATADITLSLEDKPEDCLTLALLGFQRQGQLGVPSRL